MVSEVFMRWSETKMQLLALQKEFNKEKRTHFHYSLGEGGHYTPEQKEYVFAQVAEFGIRSTSRTLKIPRRTIQRWCRSRFVQVKRCPDWVFDWAERRRKRCEFWAMRGYF